MADIFCTFKENESRLKQYFYRIGFHESRLMKNVYSIRFFNLHKILAYAHEKRLIKRL
jgi:hypothetical protein